jgi:SAM-dependent methyltransferase
MFHLSNLIPKNIKKIIKKILGYDRINIPNLDDDRQIEWSWSIKYLPHNKKVLDIGCCYSIISATASRLGNQVVGIDLNNDIHYSFDNFRFLEGNIIDLELKEKFDSIILASTIEHVGLSGRYNSPEDKDGDLKTMQKIKDLLIEGGEVILTIPVGQDMVFKPFHRIYGKERLPVLLEGFEVVASEFWIKSDKVNWKEVSKEKALSEIGSECYYGLGLFKLKLTL